MLDHLSIQAMDLFLDGLFLEKKLNGAFENVLLYNFIK
jgi:hypothetical protein